MHDLTFSVASHFHLPVVLEILEEARQWLNTKGINQWPFPFTSEWVNKRIENQEFFVANIDQETVAVFRLLNTDPSIWEENANDAIYIHSLAVRRSWQGHRLGRDLLRWAEDYTLQNHRSYLRLDCMAENSALCQYYEQAGFIACQIKEIQIGWYLYKAQLFEKVVGPKSTQN